MTRQDLTEDRAECEDVGPFVDPVDLTTGLLGAMYDGVPIAEPARERSESSEPLRAVAITVSCLVTLPAVASSETPPRGKTLARPQSITWTSPKLPTMTLLGFKSRWITPRACAYATVWAIASKIPRNRGKRVGRALAAVE